jgi:hypothetical protein
MAANDFLFILNFIVPFCRFRQVLPFQQGPCLCGKQRDPAAQAKRGVPWWNNGDVPCSKKSRSAARLLPNCASFQATEQTQHLFRTWITA